MGSCSRVAVVGAGIYGSSVAIELARRGHSVSLYDGLGIMQASSYTNQYRVHAGYHYPRSPDTIAEILEVRDTFISEYRRAIVDGVESYYAIPHEGSMTSPAAFEETMNRFELPLRPARPDWMNFRFIDKCFAVDEQVYDPEILRQLIVERIKATGIRFVNQIFVEDQRQEYDFVVYATYGTSGSHTNLFEQVQLQVAEKILIRLPEGLRNKSLVVIDGPFTAFDPYGNSGYSLFGSARYTNHWKTFDPSEQIPEPYAGILNNPEFQKVEFTNFTKMRDEAINVTPLAREAEYLGSRFTLRLIEYNPDQDRRMLRIGTSDDRTFHVFSGKVVSAIKATKIIADRIESA